MAWAWAGGGGVGAALAATGACVVLLDADDGGPLHEEIEEGRWREVFVAAMGIRGCVSAKTANPAFGACVGSRCCEFEVEGGVGETACGPQEALRFGSEGEDCVENRNGVATDAGGVGGGECIEETEGEFLGSTGEGIGEGAI